MHSATCCYAGLSTLDIKKSLRLDFFYEMRFFKNVFVVFFEKKKNTAKEMFL